MRRALVARLPALSHWFHLKPWDLDRMTQREVSEYLVQLDQIEREEAG